MSKKSLLIIGAGQYGVLAKEMAESMGAFEKVGFVDDNLPALGKIKDLSALKKDYDSVIVAIGKNELRLNLLEVAKSLGYTLATLVHPRAYVSPSAMVGEGSIVEPNATIQTSANIGVGCIVSAGAVVNHNAVIESGCHIDCNATVGARKVVPLKTKVEIGQVF